MAAHGAVRGRGAGPGDLRRRRSRSRRPPARCRCQSLPGLPQCCGSRPRPRRPGGAPSPRGRSITMTEAPTVQRAASPAVVTEVLRTMLRERTGAADVPALSYLRRKPGRGLVAVYGTPRDSDRIYTVAVTEGDAVDEGAVAVQTFPVDRQLPALATAMRPDEDRELRAALDAAGRRVLSAGAEVRLRSEEHTSELQSRRDLVCR